MSEKIGVFIVLVNQKNQVLLGKRKKSYKSGFFGCPGGRLHLTESLEDCARRELMEETGLKAKKLAYVGVVREIQEGYTFVHFVFRCDEYDGKPVMMEPNKCEGWEFYEVDRLPLEILPGHRAGIAMMNYVESLGYVDLM
jgi:8-oxo-dGTP diphosphatase